MGLSPSWSISWYAPPPYTFSLLRHSSSHLLDTSGIRQGTPPSMLCRHNYKPTLGCTLFCHPSLGFCSGRCSRGRQNTLPLPWTCLSDTLPFRLIHTAPFQRDGMRQVGAELTFARPVYICGSLAGGKRQSSFHSLLEYPSCFAFQKRVWSVLPSLEGWHSG
jgi:hypothetical protein